MIEDRDAFLPALRIVKRWARQRGVYGFNFGYLNGISLIIMLLKVEQYLRFEHHHFGKTSKAQPLSLEDSPKPRLQSHDALVGAKVSDYVLKFFEVFKGWDYTKPIFVHSLNTFEADLDMEQDAHKSAIPVLQPLGTQKCTTFGTTVSARNKFVDELQRAHDIFTTILHYEDIANLLKLKSGPGKVQDPETSLSKSPERDDCRDFGTPDTYHTDAETPTSLLPIEHLTWANLFEKERFFFNHDVYLEVKVFTLKTASAEQDSCMHKTLRGRIESKFKQLLQGLQADISHLV